MTPQFTTPCCVRVEDAKQRKEVCEKLEQYGYDVFRAINNPSDDMIFTDLFFTDGSYNNEPTYAIWKNHMVKELQKTHIDCGTNIALFLDLAGMRSDTDSKQWFYDTIAKEMNYNNGAIDFKVPVGWNGVRRATAAQIIERHKQKGETK